MGELAIGGVVADVAGDDEIVEKQVGGGVGGTVAA